MSDTAKPITSGRAAALYRAEQLVAEAVRTLVPICGHHVTIGTLTQMVDEQANLAARERLLDMAPSTARN